MLCRILGRTKRKKIRKVLYQMTQRCHYCLRPLEWEETTIDHSTPRSRGGANGLKNAKLCCVECNLDKSDKPYAFFLSHIRSENRSLQMTDQQGAQQ